MDRIIGRWWYTFFLICSSWMYAGMSLQVVDTQGVPLEQVATGQPFRLEVTVTDVSSFSQYPHVAGVEKFAVRNTGMRITTVNGRTTAHYSYELRIDTPGSYILGPAEFTIRGNTFSSNKINIRKQLLQKNRNENMKRLLYASPPISNRWLQESELRAN